jgi:hypothetical protein
MSMTRDDFGITIGGRTGPAEGMVECGGYYISGVMIPEFTMKRGGFDTGAVRPVMSC